jgi:flagella basal body P-ring formation protein FlgA
MMLKRLPAWMLVAVSLQAWATAPVFQSVGAARIVAAARTQIDAQLAGDRAAAVVTVLGAPEDVVVVPGKVTLKAHALTGRWPRARVGVPVDVSVNDRVVRSATVWFALSVHRSVLTYSADAAIGTSATSLKLAPQDIDVAAVQGELPQGPHDMDGLRLRRPVLAGSIVVREDFEPMPDVDRQQRVQVMVALGAIHLQARGTSNGKGNAGDIVPVLVDGAEAPVHARITDKGVVEVVQ